MKRVITLAAAFALVPVAARGQLPAWRYEVTNGKEDVKNAIVALPLDIKKGAYSSFGFMVIPAGQQQSLTAQLVAEGRLGSDKPELLVLIPELKAEQKMELAISAVPPPPGILPPPRLQWRSQGKDTFQLCLYDRGNFQPVMSYTQFTFDPKATPPKKQAIANPTIKPYHHVYDPTGTLLLTNGPDGRYPHHRGIYFGFNNITYNGKKADVWHCRNGESQQADPKQTRLNGGWFGMHRLNVAWRGQDGATFANETRELAAYEMPGGTLIDFRSRLTTELPDGVKLDGDPQHAGFHFRANAKVEATAKQTYFLRPDGKGELGKEINWDPKSKKGPVNLPWNAMCFQLEGKRYTVVYLDHPDNPKEARQSERTYGRVGTYFVHQLTKDKPLFVRYRLWVQAGEMKQEECEALSKAFSTALQVAKK